MGGQLADFEDGRTRVEQAVDALAGQQLAARGVAFLGLGAAAFMDAAEQPVQRADLLEHGRAVAGELRGTGVDLGVQDGHDGLRPGSRLQATGRRRGLKPVACRL
ncbi:hypothetical protein D9M71_694170 [compost metagenome]